MRGVGDARLFPPVTLAASVYCGLSEVVTRSYDRLSSGIFVFHVGNGYLRPRLFQVGAWGAASQSSNDVFVGNIRILGGLTPSTASAGFRIAHATESGTEAPKF